MLQKPLPPIELPQIWSQTQWQDMQTLNTDGQQRAGSSSDDHGAPAVKLAGVTASKPKYKLTGIKIGGKQVALAKSATPPPAAPLPEFVNKLVGVVKRANKLLKKPMQPLPEELLTFSGALPFPINIASADAGMNDSGRTTLTSADRASQPSAAAQLGELQQSTTDNVATETAVPMDFSQWMLASKLAAQQERGPEQDVGRPKPLGAQQPTTIDSHIGTAAPVTSPEACTPEDSTLPDQDPVSPAASCSDAQQQPGALQRPRGGAGAAAQTAQVESAHAAGGASAAEQQAAAKKQQDMGIGRASEEAGARAALVPPQEPARSADAVPGSPVVAVAAAEVLPVKQGGPSPARSRQSGSSSSSSSSSDDSSSSSDSESSSDSDTSSSDKSTSLSDVPLLPQGDPKGSSASKASSFSGSKRPANEVSGPSPKRQKSTEPSGKPVNPLVRLDSVREDGEIKGEAALCSTHVEDRDSDRPHKESPELHPKRSSRDRDRERSYGRESERRRDEDEQRFRRYNNRDRDADDERRWRDRGSERGRSIEEERRRRGMERERQRQEERRQMERERDRDRNHGTGRSSYDHRDRDRGTGRSSYDHQERERDRDRGTGRSSYDHRRRSRSRSRSRRPLGRTRTRSRSCSRHADDRDRRDRSRTGRQSRDRRTCSPARGERRAARSRDVSPDRRPDRGSAEQERRVSKVSTLAEHPSQAAKEQLPQGGASGAMAPPTAREAPKKPLVPAPEEVVDMELDETVGAGSTTDTAAARPSNISQAQATPATTKAPQALLSSQRREITTTLSDPVPANDLSDAAKALALALRAALERQPNEGMDSAAELHKQVISRKKLAKIVVEKSLEFERQLQALIAAGASLEDRKKLLKQMASHTLEGIILTLKAHVHFLRWAAVGERMIAQGRGMDWAAAVQDPSALAAKGMQAKHVLVSEYQSFIADLQQKDFRQLFGIAKARFQRAAGLHPLSKGMLSKGIQFIDLARFFGMRLEMVTAVRTNAFQAPSLKQHENGLRSVEDAFRQAQRQARQAQQPQQQRGAQGGPRGHPMSAAVAKQPVDAGETFQRPSPGDSNNSETTASTPPSAHGQQNFMAPAMVPSVAGLPLHQAGTKGDLGSYVIPQRFARSQEVILNSHQRFVSVYDMAASRETNLMLVTMMEDEDAAVSRVAALIYSLGVDAALMDIMAVPTLGRQCLEGLRALRDSLGLSPAQSSAA
ncbi:g4113 [Coccomyxa elongata]